jgi:hypothetical protein
MGKILWALFLIAGAYMSAPYAYFYLNRSDLIFALDSCSHRGGEKKFWDHYLVEQRDKGSYEGEYFLSLINAQDNTLASICRKYDSEINLLKFMGVSNYFINYFEDRYAD